jgi:thiamine biosynthesis lipoprotein ApbE
MWADAFATTAFVMGDDGLAWLARYPDYNGFSVCNYPKNG